MATFLIVFLLFMGMVFAKAIKILIPITIISLVIWIFRNL